MAEAEGRVDGWPLVGGRWRVGAIVELLVVSEVGIPRWLICMSGRGKEPGGKGDR